MKYRIFCLLLLVYALILGGCSSQENNSKDGDISESECANFENGKPTVNADGITYENVYIEMKTSVDEISMEFENNGYTVICESVEPQILTGKRYLLTLGGVSDGRIIIYEYENSEQAQIDVYCIDESGSTVILEDQTHYVEWKSIPHFYWHNNLIIQYVGTDTNILSLLTNLYGEQFAGGDTE